jgi:hypothetical protein
VNKCCDRGLFFVSDILFFSARVYTPSCVVADMNKRNHFHRCLAPPISFAATQKKSVIQTILPEKWQVMGGGGHFIVYVRKRNETRGRHVRPGSKKRDERHRVNSASPRPLSFFGLDPRKNSSHDRLMRDA